MDIDGYCVLSSLKITVARFHLEQFEELLATGSEWGDDIESRTAPYHAHADGAIFEMFAAFDSFSCAAAHRFGLADPDKSSFDAVAKNKKVPAGPSARLQETIDASEWKRLKSLRHLASHRGVISHRLVWNPGLDVYLPEAERPYRDEDKALPVMKDLLRWSEGRLGFLWPSVTAIPFRTADRIRELRGGEVGIQTDEG